MTAFRLFFVVVLCCLAQPAIATEPVIEPSDSTDRVVILNNGAVYRGEVVELEPRSHVVLRLASGAVRRFEWRDLRRVGGTSASPPAAPSARAPVPVPERLPPHESARPTPTETRPAAEKVRERTTTSGSYSEHLTAAKVLEQLGQVSDALTEYEEAYKLRADSFLLYRMASMHDQLDQSREALRLYRRYLAEVPNMPEERQTEVATNIARLSMAISESNPTDRPRGRTGDSADGARSSRLASTGLLAAGISIWATSYLATVITAGLGLAGTTTSQFLSTYSSGSIAKAQATLGVLMIPVGGPIISSALAPAPEWVLPWIFIGAGSQIAGMAMTIAGGRSKPTGSAPSALLLPMLSPANTGLAFVGSF